MSEGPWTPGDAALAGQKRHAPATVRNRDAIADVLSRELPTAGLVLEVASGSGEHVVHFAGLFPALEWQPSDPDAAAISSIAAWRQEAGLSNVRAPVLLDASAGDWPVKHAEAIFCANMTHISPWAATLGLFAGAERLLAEGAPLIVYGPFLRDDVETAPGNLAFDADLRARNAGWGLRAAEDLDEVAARHGFARTALHEMPANNLTLVWRSIRRPQAAP